MWDTDVVFADLHEPGDGTLEELGGSAGGEAGAAMWVSIS